MAELETSEKHPNSRVLEHDALQERLDNLLEQYLKKLDEYVRSRNDLSENLSAGFMSLSKANFTSQSRTRYGQDYYDERMQASRRVVVNSKEGRTEFLIEHHEIRSLSHQDERPEEDSTDEKNESNSTLDPADSEKIDDANLVEGDGNEPKPVVRDPIHWFGLLVPQELRKCQSSFVTAIDEAVGHLTTVEGELNRVAIEVRRTRKQIDKLR